MATTAPDHASKVLVSQLYGANIRGERVFSLRGRFFSFVWIQGTIIEVREGGTVIINDEVRTKRSLIIDDGSGIISVDDARPDVHEDEKWRKGQYVMVIGPASSQGQEGREISAHQIIDLSYQPDRESLWSLEVIYHWTEPILNSQ